MKTYVLMYFKFNELHSRSFIEYFVIKIEIPTPSHIFYALSCILRFTGWVWSTKTFSWCSISVAVIREGIKRALDVWQPLWMSTMHGRSPNVGRIKRKAFSCVPIVSRANYWRWIKTTNLLTIASFSLLVYSLWKVRALEK